MHGAGIEFGAGKLDPDRALRRNFPGRKIDAGLGEASAIVEIGDDVDIARQVENL